MKLYSTNRINALGLTGPEQTYKHFPQAKLIKVDNQNIQESQEILYKESKKIFTNSNEKSLISQKARSNKRDSPQTAKQQAKKSPVIFLGGDHSITYPIFKSFRDTVPNPFLIIFDAHADCDIPNQEPTHEEWLRKTIQDGLPGNKVILIGTRKTWEIEDKFLKENNVKIFPKLPSKKEILPLIQNHNLYISIDIDALNPSDAPAVNYPEPAGLNKKNFLKFLDFLLTQNPKAIDITEYCPNKDKDNKTLNLIKEITTHTSP
jgi:arginase family enzyme